MGHSFFLCGWGGGREKFCVEGGDVEDFLRRMVWQEWSEKW